MISRHPATSLRPCRPVPDLVSTRLPTLSKTDRLWVGLLGHLGGARVQMSRQALGGARPLISQAVQGRESLWRDPLPQAGAAQDRDKKAFLDPHPRQAGRGPGGPGRGGSATALTGPRREDVLGDVGGLGSPLADSHRPNEPAAPLPPSAASCSPPRPRWRRQDTGAGGGDRTETAAGGRRAQGAGGRDHLGAAWQWEKEASPGGERAWPGPAPLISVLSPPLRDLDGPAAGAGSAGSFACR